MGECPSEIFDSIQVQYGARVMILEIVYPWTLDPTLGNSLVGVQNVFLPSTFHSETPSAKVSPLLPYCLAYHGPHFHPFTPAGNRELKELSSVAPGCLGWELLP